MGKVALEQDTWVGLGLGSNCRVPSSLGITKLERVTNAVTVLVVYYSLKPSMLLFLMTNKSY